MKLKGIATAAVAAASSLGFAQIPDLLSGFEMGGRAMGMGGAIYSNATDASASYWNPAGLGHVSEGMFELNYRNRPDTSTSLSGRYDIPDRAGDVGFGSNTITFAGGAFPASGGTIGISYAVGGWVRESAFGTGLTNPNNPPQSITTTEFFHVVSEFYTLAYGKKMGETSSWGAGIVFARQKLDNRIFQRDQNQIVLQDTDISDEGTGFGAIIGVQFTPGNDKNVSWGFSYRTPIKLNGFDAGDAYADEIPGRLQGGVAWRVDGLRGGKDFLVAGVDLSYFFAANSGKILERDTQISAGVGFEYNWAHSSAIYPIRFGYRGTDSAGENFRSRQAFTFGFGYRPKNNDFCLDLNFATANHQNRPDMAFSISLPMGK